MRRRENECNLECCTGRLGCNPVDRLILLSAVSMRRMLLVSMAMKMDYVSIFCIEKFL